MRVLSFAFNDVATRISLASRWIKQRADGFPVVPEKGRLGRIVFSIVYWPRSIPVEDRNYLAHSPQRTERVHRPSPVRVLKNDRPNDCTSYISAFLVVSKEKRFIRIIQSLGERGGQSQTAEFFIADFLAPVNFSFLFHHIPTPPPPPPPPLPFRITPPTSFLSAPPVLRVSCILRSSSPRVPSIILLTTPNLPS